MILNVTMALRMMIRTIEMRAPFSACLAETGFSSFHRTYRSNPTIGIRNPMIQFTTLPESVF